MSRLLKNKENGMRVHAVSVSFLAHVLRNQPTYSK